MNEPLIALLSHPDREELLVAIDGALGQTPSAADVLRTRTLIPDGLQDSSSALIDIVLGTRKARKLGKGLKDWWFTTQGAEQATHPAIAEHHAKRFAGCSNVVEICTGAGLDTLALARKVDRLTTYESDPISAALAAGNLVASGVLNVDVRAQEVGNTADVGEFDGLWADPSRRRGDGRRTSGIAEYSPQLETLTEMCLQNPNAVAGIKCGPGDDIPASLTAHFTSEYIGFAGECRERILWRNATHGVADPRELPLRVSLIDAGLQWSPSDRQVQLPRQMPQQGDVLVEPHPALIASGAVGAFFAEHRLTAVHPMIAYGIGSEHDVDLDALAPWTHLFTIVDVDRGVSEKRIQQRLRALGWNRRTEFKKRGWNGEPEELRRRLEFADTDAFGVVIIARTEDGHLTLYCLRRASRISMSSS